MSVHPVAPAQVSGIKVSLWLRTKTPPAPLCSSSKDPGAVRGRQRAVRLQSSVSGPGSAAAGRPVARPGRPAGGFLRGAPGSELAGSAPQRQPADGRAAGSAVHLQRHQPAGQRPGGTVRPASPAVAAVSRHGHAAPPAAVPGSRGEGGSGGGGRGVDGPGRGSAGNQLLEEITCSDLQ